jgi:hypothetical protein
MNANGMAKKPAIVMSKINPMKSAANVVHDQVTSVAETARKPRRKTVPKIM